MAQIELHDIYGFSYTPFWHETWFVVTVAVLGLAVLALVIWLVRWWLERRRLRRPPLTSWEEAFRALERLTQNPPTTKEECKAFYFALSDIVKAYLGRRFTWQLSEKTDEELLVFLRAQHLDPALCTLVEQVTSGAMHIKFADAESMREQAERDSAQVYELIERTRVKSENE